MLGLTMPIQVLPAEVVSRIAAGEVVERPASVVKELVENAIDAGATQITVEVRGGGVELIRVLDNGSGIPAAQVELAFHRYATSKIGSLTDLESIASLGFRGEALPSIAAVAAVELFTQARGEDIGTFFSLREGQVVQKQARSRPPGTSLTVRHLFRHFPARLKFLKSRSTETGHITAVVSQYALSFPDISFTLYAEGRGVLRTSGDGSLRQAAAEVHGDEMASALLEVSSPPQTLPEVSGLISPPTLTRSTRNLMSFFVNQRWVRNPQLSWAVEDAYQGLLPEGKHPVAIIHLTLPPGEVDVNIHPAKAEVRFSQQRAVTVALHQAVGQGLGVVPRPRAEPAPSWLLPPGGGEQGEIFSPLPLPPQPTPSLLRVIGQVASSYIVAEGPDGIYLIDQHTAHERVLYEKILHQRQQRAVDTQGLLEPLLLEVDPGQEASLRRYGEALQEYGFALEHFGQRSYLVRSVPALLRGEGVREALLEVLDSLGEGGREEVEKRVATPLACHGAVKAGQVLSLEDMRELVRGLEECHFPRLCPHGRPILIHLSAEQLEKQFGRR